MADAAALSPRQRAPSGTASNHSTTSSAGASSVHISAIKYAHQAAQLSHLPQDADGTNDTAAAVKAEFITPQDPIIITAGGGRLPAVPLEEAHKLNHLKAELEGGFEDVVQDGLDVQWTEKGLGQVGGLQAPQPTHTSGTSSPRVKGSIQKSAEGTLKKSMPPFRTNPLFPPLPLYGPPTTMRNIQCFVFQCTSAVLSLAFLGAIVLGSVFTSIPVQIKRFWLRLNFQDPDADRPFYEEEKRRAVIRAEKEEEWAKQRARRGSNTMADDEEASAGENDGFPPTEGGPDPLVCDVGYYARRVGLDVESFKVETEDGFLIDLWHVYDPASYTPLHESQRGPRGPELFTNTPPSRAPPPAGQRKYPVLMIHGLLQSSGAYCVNDDSSLAFYLCKSGYDVWLGNNRCGFRPLHTLLSPSDPRMWAWNIRQMGVLDLPALTSRVLHETGFPKLGLICHSQGTTQTFVALAKEQRPELGEKISVFCALAPAAYAGPLIGKMYFKIMRLVSPAVFRLTFGIHAFIPLMMGMHRWLPGSVYGKMGYKVFNYLFNWSDARWESALRDRMFQFAPVYVSAESMRWWLGRECFAKQKCILQTREEWRREEREDELDEKKKTGNATETHVEDVSLPGGEREQHKHRAPKGSTAWYDARSPPLALWIAGSDDLVDGRRLLKRFTNGREPFVKLVHAKIIPEYEHLDVLWAMDAIEQVGREVREVLWKTAEGREGCRIPRGCEGVEVWRAGGREGGTETETGTGQSSSEAVEGADGNVSPRLKRRNWMRRLFSH